jgi:hypothetical protein
MFVTESAGTSGVAERVPATGCASGDIMWLLDEPNQPYEGNSVRTILSTVFAIT